MLKVEMTLKELNVIARTLYPAIQTLNAKAEAGNADRDEQYDLVLMVAVMDRICPVITEALAKGLDKEEASNANQD